MATKKGLGRGLDALFFENDTPETGQNTELLSLSEIEPNREQPRKAFDPEALQTLADSIRENGLLQPILVRPLPGGGYQIVAGERRWRASRMAGLTQVPVVIRELDDAKAMAVALIENLQREDLNPVEEAAGYRELMDRFSMTQAQVAENVGKSRPVVANALRLLSLTKPVLAAVEEKRLSAGHARALCAVEDPAVQEALAEQVIRQELTVRETERLVKNALSPEKPAKIRKTDSFYGEAELALKETLGRKVKIKADEKGQGRLELPFYSKEDLTALLKQIGKE